MPGTYVLKPVEANLTHDTGFITKMNPYCSFTVGDKKVNTQICPKGGKHPVWNDAVTITVDEKTDSQLVVDIIDEGKITRDRIGSLTLDLSELEKSDHKSKWYPLYFNDEPAGELLLEAYAQDSAPAPTPSQSHTHVSEKVSTSDLITTTSHHMVNEKLISQSANSVVLEQRQVVEPHVFTKEVERVETVPIKKQIEVLEPTKVIKEVEYTEYVPVMKRIEIMEPRVVEKEIEVLEPQVFTKTIQVVENVLVKKNVEVVEMRPVIREIHTMEPRTFKKQIEVTEQLPVMKEVTITEPVTVKKTVEYVEPVVTTQTITKEVVAPVVVDQKIETFVGAATLVENVVVGNTTTLEQDQMIGKVVETEVRETRIYTDDILQADLKTTEIQTEVQTEVQSLNQGQIKSQSAKKHKKNKKHRNQNHTNI